jgi:hypothetical protein
MVLDQASVMGFDFDMSGRSKRVKWLSGRPLDGAVRQLSPDGYRHGDRRAVK